MKKVSFTGMDIQDINEIHKSMCVFKENFGPWDSSWSKIVWREIEYMYNFNEYANELKEWINSSNLEFEDTYDIKWFDAKKGYIIVIAFKSVNDAVLFKLSYSDDD